MHISKKDDFYQIFNFRISDFWQTHYTFEKVSKKSTKRITKSFVDLILINTILPLKFVYLQHRNEFDQEPFLDVIRQIKSEKNSIISKFSDLKIKANTAMDSQALLQLKNNYCTQKKCLHCAIGNDLLRK